MFRFLMSALMLDVPPTQIVFGVPLARSCRYVNGTTSPVGLVKSSPGAGPVLIPHQSSFAVNIPEPRKMARPLGAVLFTIREKVTVAVVPLEKIAPPELPAKLVVKELVVTVSGPPLSTMIAPPLRFGALLLEKLEVLTL